MRTAVAAMLAGMRGRGKAFILTSTTAVYGDTGDQPLDEQTPTGGRNPFTAWLGDVEQQVLRAPGVRGSVVRPALVYGRGNGRGVLSQIQAARQAGAGLFVGSVDTLSSSVHIDALAELYLLVLDKAPAGTLLNAASGQPITRRAIAEAASQAAGLSGATRSITIEEAIRVLGPAAMLLTMNQVVSSEKAKRLLGWSPDSPSLAWDLRHGSYSR